jgi:hypothetical protein
MGRPTYLANLSLLSQLSGGDKPTIKGLRAVLNTLKTKRVILAGDFNSTKTLSSFDTGGPLPPSIAKDRTAKAIQEVLNDWRFKDLWTKETNEQWEKSGPTGTINTPGGCV